MKMYFKEQQFNNSPEYLASEKHVSFTFTVSDEGVVSDEHGKKYVLAGTLMATDGKTFTAAVDQELGGILFATVEVTHGPQVGACMVEGYVREARLPQADTNGVLAENLKTALAATKITLR